MFISVFIQELLSEVKRVLLSQAVSAQVTKHFVTIFSKTFNNVIFENRLLYYQYTLWKVLFCVNMLKRPSPISYFCLVLSLYC